MPITKSAQKALRQSKKRRIANLQRANTYKAEFKKLKKMSSEGQLKDAQKQLAEVYKSIDKAAKTGVIKKNKASRLKSAASKLLAKQ